MLKLTIAFSIAGQKSPRYFDRQLRFFSLFQNVYLLILQIYSESLTMFRGTLFGNHWYKVRYMFRLNDLIRYHQAMVRNTHERKRIEASFSI